MIKSFIKIAALAAIALLPTSAMAQFNGLKVNPRVFNDYPNSTLTIVNSNTIPGNASIDDRNMTNATGNGANRHDILLSMDHGATAAVLNSNTPFTISADVTLTDGSNTPRKEAGLRINSSQASGVGDSLFIINSDAGEIVAFGGPFYNFRDPAGFNEPAYVPGQTITMGMIYRPGNPATTGATPATIEYFINRGSGVKSSGPLAFGNLEGGPVDFTVGMYGQGGSGNNAADFLHVTFNNINATVPEPTTLGLLSLGGLALVSRRRKSA